MQTSLYKQSHKNNISKKHATNNSFASKLYFSNVFAGKKEPLTVKYFNPIQKQNKCWDGVFIMNEVSERNAYNYRWRTPRVVYSMIYKVYTLSCQFRIQSAWIARVSRCDIHSGRRGSSLRWACPYCSWSAASRMAHWPCLMTLVWRYWRS